VQRPQQPLDKRLSYTATYKRLDFRSSALAPPVDILICLNFWKGFLCVSLRVWPTRWDRDLKKRTYAPSKSILGDPTAALSSSGMDVAGEERYPTSEELL